MQATHYENLAPSLFQDIERAVTPIYPSALYWLSQTGAILSCFAFNSPICAGSDLICIYSIDLVTKLFKGWGQNFKKKIEALQLDKNLLDDQRYLNSWKPISI